MTEKNNVLVVGLDPTLIDFSATGYQPGMTLLSTTEKEFCGTPPASAYR